MAAARSPPPPSDLAAPEPAPQPAPQAAPPDGAGGAARPQVPRSAWLRLALLLVILAAAAGSLLLWSPTTLLDGGLSAGTPWHIRVPLFVAVYAVATTAFFPRPALNAAAGLLLGVREGTVLAVLGTAIGAALAFWLCRRLGREALRPYLRGRLLLALDRRFSEQGFRSVFLLRLLPGLPFQAGNVGAAFSGVRFLPFVVATALGAAPLTAVYVTAAATAREPGSAGFLLSAGAIVLLGLVSLVSAVRGVLRRRRAAMG
ncbi:TVP38/TMEM64 family protein [Kitasatospora sp. NPDC056184]|uniref:TVP38/TMEM64 family protein n=1 Tax=Kitasatospora sp. NPDC056184 TaxID=3345738 RepID=UPI0035E00945